MKRHLELIKTLSSLIAIFPGHKDHYTAEEYEREESFRYFCCTAEEPGSYFLDFQRVQDLLIECREILKANGMDN